MGNKLEKQYLPWNKTSVHIQANSKQKTWVSTFHWKQGRLDRLFHCYFNKYPDS